MNKQFLSGFLAGFAVAFLASMVIWFMVTGGRGLNPGEVEAQIVMEQQAKDEEPFERSLDVKIGGPFPTSKVMPGEPGMGVDTPDGMKH